MRQFLALEIPADQRRRLGRLQTRLAPRLAGWRWVRPEGIHLTLRFLGEVDEERDRRGRELWNQVARSTRPFRYRISGLGGFPPRGRLRVLWIGVRDDPMGALVGLANGLELASRSLGFAAEQRRFQPHLTLARAGRGGVSRLPALPDVAGSTHSVAAGELLLFRSEPQSGGSRYTALAAYPFLGSEGGKRSPRGE